MFETCFKSKLQVKKHVIKITFPPSLTSCDKTTFFFNFRLVFLVNLCGEVGGTPNFYFSFNFIITVKLSDTGHLFIFFKLYFFSSVIPTFTFTISLFRISSQVRFTPLYRKFLDIFSCIQYLISFIEYFHSTSTN